ncbi:eL24 family ribosomal protein [Roseimaritima sediminicola]|uniref:hypothetical protein n=1 Tax=Roseimaritima sediminicola TaxID=2662066 RepID=UPI00129853D6|nr:hypothetical protein [Roseimaritima sediminicola]
MKKMIGSIFGVALVACATVWATEPKLDDVKCVVASRNASADKSADYKEGKVFFCCNGCKGKFEKAPEKFTAKANHQLVATEQYEETACPISGRDLNPETKTKVAGVEVAFCCNGCKGKVEKAEGKEKIELVFGEKAFKKGFKPAEADEPSEG